MERREFKYLVPPDRIPALRGALARVGHLDRHAGPDGSYTIRTLYLDTPHLALYWANEREAPERFKARIRCYPGATGALRPFFEIKRRTLDVIRKTRFASPSSWAALPLEDTLGLQVQDPQWERFSSLVHTYGLQPKVLVEYRREAWMSELDDYARVSIDGSIRYQPVEHWNLETWAGAWTHIDHVAVTQTRCPVAVVELKFADAPPRWMVDLVHWLELIRHAFSKYCYSVDDWLAGPGLRLRGRRAAS